MIVDEMKRQAMKVTNLQLRSFGQVPYSEQTVRLYLSYLIKRRIVERVPHSNPGLYFLVGFPYHRKDWHELVVSGSHDERERQQILYNITVAVDRVVRLAKLLEERLVSVVEWVGSAGQVYDEGWILALGYSRSKWGYKGRSWKWDRKYDFAWGSLKVTLFKNMRYNAQASFRAPQRIGSETLREWMGQVDELLSRDLRGSRREERPVRMELTIDESGGPLWEYMAREMLILLQLYRRKEKARRGVHLDLVFEKPSQIPELSRWVAGELYLPGG